MMADQADAIGDVLGGFVPLGTDHPAAQQLAANVAALKAQQAADDEDAETFHAVTVEVVPGCIIRPGDVLVLTAGERITQEAAHQIKAEIFRRLPGIADVVVLGGVYVSGVYREGGDDVAPS